MVRSTSRLRITVVEYPKSGGTWLVSMLGDYFDIPKRDIYVRDGYNVFDITKHPWYQDTASLDLTESCVIKSHELPNSMLHNFSTKYIQLVRDGRDVIVSKYIYERDFCVKNGIYDSFDVPWDVYLQKTAYEWRDFVKAWIDEGHPWFRYEDLLTRPVETLRIIIESLEFKATNRELILVVEKNSKKKMRKSLANVFKYNTFVRNARAGDWNNYFSSTDLDTFDNIAGEAMRVLGYGNQLINYG